MGYAFGSIDEMGDGVFRKVRRELGVTAFGVNVLVLAPGIVSRPHYHDEHDEILVADARHLARRRRLDVAQTARPELARLAG